MFGYLVFLVVFAVGSFFIALTLAVLSRSYKKRIRSLEKRILDTEREQFDFMDRIKKLIFSVRESANTISISGNTANTHDFGMEKIEKTINENAKIASEVVDKTNSVAAIA